MLVVLLPVAFLVSAALMQSAGAPEFPQRIRNLLSMDTVGMSGQQLMFASFHKLIAPLLFLAVTVICAVSVASCGFIVEKESHTMETLMLSSMNHKAIFNAKVSESVIFSVFLSLVSFIACMIALIVGGNILKMPFFFNWEWFVILFLLMPALSLFCTVFISLLAPRIHTVGESLQTIGYFIFVIAIFYLLQIAGVWNMNALFQLVLAVLLFIADFFLYNTSARRFTPEVVLQRGKESIYES